MPELPPEQILIDQLADWLADIRIANGYYTDAGLYLDTEEIDDPGNPPPAALLLLDESAAAVGKNWIQQIVVEGAVTVEPKTARVIARQLQADIARAIRTGLKANAHNTRIIRAVRITGKEIPRREPGENLLIPTVNVEMEYYDRP